MQKKIIFHSLFKICLAFCCVLMIPLYLTVYYQDGCFLPFFFTGVVALLMAGGFKFYSKAQDPTPLSKTADPTQNCKTLDLTQLKKTVAPILNDKDEDSKKMSIREGIGTVFFSWVLVAFLASLPFKFGGFLSLAGAYFESMSGLTTTGATCFRSLDNLPQSILMWRSLTQWIGGIGIIVLFVAFLPQMPGSAQYLFNAEATGFSASRIKPRIKSTAL